MYGYGLSLRFRPGDPSGFTPAGIAGFSNLKPAAIVRELVQNSLDAAGEAKKTRAVVRFRLTRCGTQHVPGMGAYYDAFHAAVDTHKEGGKLPSQASRVVAVMRRALNKNKQDVLAVLDNGIGLDVRRMHALLSDGISAKGGTATGTFGNGHSAVIPASDLRYILYGGVTRDGDRIGAGHAVIASWKDGGRKHQRSGNGYLVRGFRNGSYQYAKKNSLPDLIKENLKDIQEKSEHGTAVIIPAFNHFRMSRKSSLWDIVSKAAACNFFQAIEEDRLAVEVEDCRSGKSNVLKRLDSSTLGEVLEKNRNQKRVKGFLSGQKAFSAYAALRQGGSYEIGTSLGAIRVRILERPSGTSRVDLCRNGMWITDDKNIPTFYYAFGDRKPFHALLLLDSQSGGRLHELVRNAEGPLHDKLDVGQRLTKSEARELRKAFGDIKEQLKSLVPEIGSDQYSPDDFLTLDFGQGSEGGNARPSFWGTPLAVSRRHAGWGPNAPAPGGGGAGLGGGGGSGNKRPTRPALRPFFHVASVPLGDDRRQIRLDCQQACKNAELRLRIDENLDETCDNLRGREIGMATLQEVRVLGKRVASSKLVREKGRYVGVRLGDVAANTSLDVEVRYAFPGDKPFLPSRKAALRVEVFAAREAADQEK